MTLFSLIVATRGRPDGLRRLLDSLRDTATDPQSLEVIAVMDEDDPATLKFSYTGLSFERVVVPSGQTMGNLNLAGFRAARGRYLMLLNDDVVARTSGWDDQLQQVFETYPDGMVLAHVNELIFRDTLCTFPCLTREFCDLAGGISRPEYRRYRIDDHIHHVFDLLHLLGHTRRIFLPEVVFDHENPFVKSSAPRTYVPNPAIHALDTVDFEALLEERRRLALRCLERIEGPASAVRHAAQSRLLERFPDSIAVRRREHALVWRAPGGVGLLSRPRMYVPAHSPAFRARAVYRAWKTLAKLSAQWPVLAKVGIPAALFDAEWYLASYPDVAARGVNPLLDYLERGGFEGRNPNPHFDSSWYLATNPDVAASGLNPLVHFLRCGAGENRRPNLLFDAHYYKRENPEVAASGMSPFEHFVTRGIGQGRAPCASVGVPEYWRRIASDVPARRIELREPPALSIVIPTRNRKDILARTLEACHQHRSGCELEFLVVDDGSDDGTPDLLRQIATRIPNLRWQSISHAGPGRARNVAAALARHDVLLFLGNDIVPTTAQFFRSHAARHAQHPERNFAVLGAVEWPNDADFDLNFTMALIQEHGWQFAFSRLTPGAFVGWQYFYTANLSVKKALVRDWAADGFDARFPGAALEDIEFGYRLSRSPQGVRLYYDPASVGWHYHPHTLESFSKRQSFVGRSLRRLLELHPELADEYGVGALNEALRKPRRKRDAETMRRVQAEMEALKIGARSLEEQGELGSRDWHASFLSALFELRMSEGYAEEWPPEEVNLAAAREVILKRFFSRLRQVKNCPSRLFRATPRPN